MFDELIDGLVMGAAAGAASTWAGHKMTPTPGIPIWTGAVGDTAMTLMRETSGRRTHYELWVVELGQAAVQVGRYPVYPDAVAAIGQWGKYTCMGAARLRPGAYLNGPHRPPSPR